MSVCYKTHLILLVEQFQLVVNQAVLSALFLPQSPFLLQLRAPERLDAMHTGAQLLIRQFQLLLKVPQLPLQIGILRLQLSKEEGGWFASIVFIFRVVRRRRGVGPVIVAFEGLVARGPRPGPVVRARGGATPSLLGRRRRLIFPGEVGAPARRAPVLRDATAAGVLPAVPVPSPFLPPLVRVLPEIQLDGFSYASP